MKNIVILSNEIGIIYKFRFELLKELTKENNVFLLSPKTEGQDFFLSEILNLKVKHIEINLDRRSYNLLQELFILKQYYKFLKEIKPDKVIAYTIKPNIYGGIVCRFLKLEYYVTITGIGSIFEKNNFLLKVVKIVYRVALKRAKNVFFQNKFGIQLFLNERIVKKEQVILVNGSGVNLDRFKAEIKERKGKYNFLFIARIMKSKGIEEYLKAAELMKNKYGEKVEFQILGQFEENEYKKQIKELEEENIVKYLGISSDVRNELRNIHCLINPSWNEGMSNVLLEAGAMKRFLIASDIPGCREIVIDNETGFTFEKENVRELVDKIEKFINLSEKEYKEFIKKSYEYILKNYSRDIVVKEYLDKIL